MRLTTDLKFQSNLIAKLYPINYKCSNSQYLCIAPISVQVNKFKTKLGVFVIFNNISLHIAKLSDCFKKNGIHFDISAKYI